MRRLTLATLAAALVGVTLALPTLSDAEETATTQAPSSDAAAARPEPVAQDDEDDDDHDDSERTRATSRDKERAAPARRTRASEVARRAKPSSAPAPSPTASQGSSDTAAATGTTTGTTSPAAGVTTTGGPFLPYSADSYFRKALPSVTPVSTDNNRLVSFAKSANKDPYLKIRGANGVGWGIAFAEADCNDPVYRIRSSRLPASQAHLATEGFHAPASLWQNIPPNADAPFLVVDRCGTSARPGGLSVWGTQTTVSGSTVSAGYAGAFAHDTNGLDRRNPRSDSKLNERSRGVIPDSMVIRLDALDHAIRSGQGMGYVLEVFWVETDTAAGFAHPMVGAESGKAGAGAEGQRFRIKPGIDLASRPGCGAVGLAIARTLQQHGAYIGDNSGSGSGIKTEQNAVFPGLNADSLKGCMTWDDIEFLPLGWDG